MDITHCKGDGKCSFLIGATALGHIHTCPQETRVLPAWLKEKRLLSSGWECLLPPSCVSYSSFLFPPLQQKDQGELVHPLRMRRLEGPGVISFPEGQLQVVPNRLFSSLDNSLPWHLTTGSRETSLSLEECLFPHKCTFCVWEFPTSSAFSLCAKMLCVTSLHP